MAGRGWGRSKMAGNDLNINIGGDSIKAIIDAQVRGAVAVALGKNSASLIEALIAEAFNERTSSYGDKETKFGAAVKEAIRKEGKAAFEEWLEEMRPQIRASFARQLKTSGPKQIFDAFIKSIEGNEPRMSLHMTLFAKDEGRF